MKTLTIAGDERTAHQISNFFMYSEAPRQLFDPKVRDAHLAEYEWCSAYRADRPLLGARYQRIVIGTDYLQWRLGEPGRLTNLWRMIEIARCADGVQVVFK